MEYLNTTLYPSALMVLMQGVLANSVFSNFEPLLPIVEPAKPIMEENAHLALVLAMASFWRIVCRFQLLLFSPVFEQESICIVQRLE